MQNVKIKSKYFETGNILIGSLAILLSACNGVGGVSGVARVVGFDVKSDAVPLVAMKPSTWEKLLSVVNPFPTANAVPVESIFVSTALVTLGEIKISGTCAGESGLSSSESSVDAGPTTTSTTDVGQSSSEAADVPEGERHNDETGECEMNFKGPFEVDLLSADTTPLVSGLTDGAVWDRIRWKTLKNDHSNEQNLANRSFYLEAQVGDVALTFESAESYTFQLSNILGINSGDVENFRFQIPIKQILSNVDLSGLGATLDVSEANPIPTDTSRCPAIKDSANSIYECLAEGIQQDTRESHDD